MSDFAALLARFTATVEQGDFDGFGSLFTEDGCYEDLFYGRNVGPAAVADMVRRWYADGEDYKWDMFEPVSNGTVGYAHFIFSFTGKTKHNAGKRAVVMGAAQFRLRGDRIVQYTEWADNMGALRQLGAPGDLLERVADRFVKHARGLPEARRHY